MGVPHAPHAASPARLLAIMADAKAVAQNHASHVQSHVLGSVSTRYGHGSRTSLRLTACQSFNVA